MGSTSAAPYQNKLLMTGALAVSLSLFQTAPLTSLGPGLFSDEVVVCTIPPVQK